MQAYLAGVPAGLGFLLVTLKEMREIKMENMGNVVLYTLRHVHESLR